MKPTPFFLGLFCGLICLSYLGSHVVSDEWARQFTRFQRSIHSESNYFPTIRQLTQILDAGDTSKIAVVVGGTSVFYGTGQHDSLMWTRQLQQDLGPSFRVFNFAQRGGRANDFGNIAAEILIERNAPVIYVTDGMPVQFSIPYIASAYKPQLVEAKEQGYLLPWPPRDKLLSLRPTWKPDALQSAHLGAILDKFLHFDDLWNYIAFEFVNMNWAPLLALDPYTSRSSGHYSELTPDQIASLRYAYPNDVELEAVRSWIIGDADPRWKDIVRITEDTMPTRLRRVTVAAINLRSPRYLNQLAASEREAFLATANHHTAELARIGFARTLISGTGFTDDDYIDGLHLSVSGGRKLADRVAPEVLSLARELGYLQ
jgi:hypothetical protein